MALRSAMFVLATGLLVAVGAAQDSSIPIDIPNGPVQTWAVDGQTLYIAGEFDAVGPATGALAVTNRDTGEIAHAVELLNGDIRAVASDGAGGWVVAGTVLTPDRTDVAFAHVRSDGTVRYFPIPSLSNRVHDMVLAGDTLFLGGSFSARTPTSGSNLAAVSLSTGEFLDWDPEVDDQVFDLELVGDALFVAGRFEQIGGESVAGLAKFDATTLAREPWTPLSQGEVRFISTSAEAVYMVGSGEVVPQSGGVPTKTLAVDATTGADLGWRAPAATGSLGPLLVTDEGVYFTGQFTEIGGVAREALALLDLSNGSVLPFDAQISLSDAYPLMRQVKLSGDSIVIEGDFTQAGGQQRNGLARIDRDTAQATPWTATADRDTLFAVACDGDEIALAGRFDTLNAVPRSTVAAIDLATGQTLPWDPQIEADRSRDVRILSILPQRDRVILAGEFVMIDGLPVKGVAAVNKNDGSLILTFDAALELDAGNQLIETPHGLLFTANDASYVFATLLDSDSGLPQWITPFTMRAGLVEYDAVRDTFLVAGHNDTSDPETDRNGVFELDARTGALTDFAPDVDVAPEIELIGDRLFARARGRFFIDGIANFELGSFIRTADGWSYDTTFGIDPAGFDGSFSSMDAFGDHLLVTGTRLEFPTGYVGARGTLRIPDLSICTRQSVWSDPEIINTVRDRIVFDAYRFIGPVWGLADPVYPGEPCRIDLNADCETNLFDFLAFLTLFGQSDPRADFDEDGELTVFDFLAFQTAFAQGC